jgi:hypothetical protein
MSENITKVVDDARNLRKTTLIIPPMADHSRTGLARRSLINDCPGVNENKDRSTVNVTISD